jgi:hypothetical protein
MGHAPSAVLRWRSCRLWLLLLAVLRWMRRSSRGKAAYPTVRCLWPRALKQGPQKARRAFCRRGPFAISVPAERGSRGVHGEDGRLGPTRYRPRIARTLPPKRGRRALLVGSRASPATIEAKIAARTLRQQTLRLRALWGVGSSRFERVAMPEQRFMMTAGSTRTRRC